MKKALFTSIAAVALFAQAMFGSDLTGKWVAETEGRDGQKRTVTFNLKADGDKLTGTVSNPMGEREISDGKITGDDVSFAVKVEMNGEARVMQYTGKVTGSELKLKTGMGDRTREMTAKRATS